MQLQNKDLELWTPTLLEQFHENSSTLFSYRNFFPWGGEKNATFVLPPPSPPFSLAKFPLLFHQCPNSFVIHVTLCQSSSGSLFCFVFVTRGCQHARRIWNPLNLELCMFVFVWKCFPAKRSKFFFILKGELLNFPRSICLVKIFF